MTWSSKKLQPKLQPCAGYSTDGWNPFCHLKSQWRDTKNPQLNPLYDLLKLAESGKMLRLIYGGYIQATLFKSKYTR